MPVYKWSGVVAPPTTETSEKDSLFGILFILQMKFGYHFMYFKGIFS